MTTSIKETIDPALLAEFDDVLNMEKVTTLYQPIISITNSTILGYEALSRGPIDSVLNSPVMLLAVAEVLNKSWELERLLRVKALENASFTNRHLLFLNVDPNIVNDQQFKKGFTKENLRKMNIAPSAIVLELTERSAIRSYDDFKLVLKHYTDQGYSIAIDDAGTGYSGLKTLYEVYPKYMKIDMDFVRNIHNDNFKQAIVKSLIDTANRTGIQTIAEGIETSDELRTLIRLGVDYGQGYFIQKPLSVPIPIKEEIISIINKENELINQIQNYSDDYHYVHHIMNNIQSFKREDPCKQVSEYLNSSECSSICVVENEFPVGMVTLNEINGAFAKQFGYSVYSQRPIELIMDKKPLIVDYYTPIQRVAQCALQRSSNHLYDDIIVTKASKYIGIVTMKDLLNYAINYEKKYAKELNPLTSLPGNVIINRVMESVINNQRNSCVLYADLDNFKVYNDVYGFEAGDRIIKKTAEILVRVSEKYLPYTSFIGHIGGDDFIIVTNGDVETLITLCNEIIKEFNESIKSYFTIKDLEKGYIIANDRHNDERTFNLTSISLAGVFGVLSNFVSTESLSEQLALLKKEAKKEMKSSYVLSKANEDSKVCILRDCC